MSSNELSLVLLIAGKILSTDPEWLDKVGDNGLPYIFIELWSDN